MTRMIAGMLTLSLAANAVLLYRAVEGRAGEAPPGRSMHAADRVAVESPPSALLETSGQEGLSAARARIAELEAQRDELEKRRAAPSAGEPSLRDRLRGLPAPGSEERRQAIEALFTELMIAPDSWGEIPRLVLEESDAAVLGALVELVLRLGPLLHHEVAAQGLLPRLLEALRRGDPAERRVAAAWLIGSVPATDPSYAIFVEAAAGAIREESDTRVVDALVHALNTDHAGQRPWPPAVTEAIRARVAQVEAGECHAGLLWALARATIAADGAQEMLDAWRRAATVAARDDVLRALARAFDNATKEQLEAARLACRPLGAERWPEFLEVYASGATGERRRELLGRFALRLGLMDLAGPACAARLREVAAREPDTDERAAMQSLAGKVDAGLRLDSEEAEKIWWER